jgi:hypothetical protein
MLLAGTFTGFVDAFVRSKGVTNFSAWTKKAGGVIVSLVGRIFYGRRSELYISGFQSNLPWSSPC